MWRRRKSKKRFLGNLGKIYWAIPFLLVAIFTFFSLKLGLFTIRQFEMQTNQLGCVNENQLKNSTGLLGQNFFLANFDNIIKNLKEKFICIKDINLSLDFPDKIKIQAIGRQPVASLMLLKDREATISSFLENVATPSAEPSSEAYLTDDEGIIFSKDTGGLNIPNIFVKDLDLSLGKKPGDKIEDSLKIMAGVKTFGLDVKTAIILDNFFIIFSHPRVIFRLDNRMDKFSPSEIDIQLASLQLILAEAKIDFKELEFIDLRFDKPIVRFAPKK